MFRIELTYFFLRYTEYNYDMIGILMIFTFLILLENNTAWFPLHNEFLLVYCGNPIFNHV